VLEKDMTMIVDLL